MRSSVEHELRLIRFLLSGILFCLAAIAFAIAPDDMRAAIGVVIGTIIVYIVVGCGFAYITGAARESWDVLKQHWWR